MVNKSQYDKKRLTSLLVPQYLKEIYGEDATIKNSEYFLISGIKPLLQKNYGEDNDCTITSLTTCLWFYNPTLTAQVIYDVVEKCGNKHHFYNGKIYGTINIFIKCIYDAALKMLGKNIKTRVDYFKNIGFNYNKIKQILKSRTPIVLSTPSDGRRYYEMHSVTIVGYATYKVNGNEDYPFLLVYDNWASVVSYVDYKKLSSLSNINYL